MIHFSYGHFFQIPEFQYLYEQPGFQDAARAAATTCHFGNADLKPQRTTQYEIGLQQQITEDIGIDVSVFYRDVRDWVGTSALIGTTYNPAVKYAQYENKDYANVRGFTFKLRSGTRIISRRRRLHVRSAEGTYLQPDDAFVASLNQNEPRLA